VQLTQQGGAQHVLFAQVQLFEQWATTAACRMHADGLRPAAEEGIWHGRTASKVDGFTCLLVQLCLQDDMIT
jgi:hypothetical protein